MYNKYKVDPSLSFGYDIDLSADTTSQDLKVTGDTDGPQTTAQVEHMSTTQLLQDPARAAIYRRGWEDRTLQQQPTVTTRFICLRDRKMRFLIYQSVIIILIAKSLINDYFVYLDVIMEFAAN
ncbi:Uncharacterized protein FWK35_00020505 [Aphis craccivora]|uniref:Uncharacterized protein n=1 Tax=Aphis craccivora TaxID=307492 RepID=A0A6G0Z4C4_APHCR|nr:Uncharacterized protein FWK35_00020505 [Aphis craccivora]